MFDLSESRGGKKERLTLYLAGCRRDPSDHVTHHLIFHLFLSFNNYSLNTLSQTLYSNPHRFLHTFLLNPKLSHLSPTEFIHSFRFKFSFTSISPLLPSNASIFFYGIIITILLCLFCTLVNVFLDFTLLLPPLSIPLFF